MTFWAIQTLNGLSFGMLLFILAAGLSLIYGVMRILNLAHGSFYILGTYVALSVIGVTGSFVLALAAGTLAVIVLGVLMERAFLRFLPQEELPQALLTFGFLLIVGDLSLWVWGGTPQTLAKPEIFERSVRMGSLVFPSYRLFVLAAGAAIAAVLWFLQERTRFGAMVRASIDDAPIASATGINVPLLSTGVFAFGAGLAAVGGIIGGPFIGVYPGADFEVLLLAFVVVIVGGLGSLNYRMIAVKDAMAEVNRDMHEAELRTLAWVFGDVRTSDEVIEMLKEVKPQPKREGLAVPA